MRTTDVHQIYDESYAEAYDGRFLLFPATQANSEFELALVRAQLGPDSWWLDIGCGTGYFLSQFPGVARAGFDLSPAMLTRAAAASPDALFFRQGDFRLPMPEWGGQWSLVSCMWAAYAYVESVKEVELVVANMVEWTRPNGAIFIPVLDLEDLRNTTVTYYEDDDLFNGSLLITGSSWTWTERDTGKTHENLVSPQVGHFVHLLAPHFDTIAVVRYPETKPGWSPRKAVLATGRRAVANAAAPAQVTWPAPLPPAGAATAPLTAAAFSHQQLLAEVGNRLRPGRLLRALQRRLFA